MKKVFKFGCLPIIVLIILIAIIGSLSGDGGNDDEKEEPVDSVETNVDESTETNDDVEDSEEVNEDVEESPESNEDEQSNEVFKTGTYLVGQDIEAGLYRVTVTDSFMGMGYVERAKDVSMELEDIIANIILTGDGYVEIKESDVAVKLQDVEIYAIDYDELEKDIKTEVEDGIYLVGIDIEPGRYKVEVTDEIMEMGYVERAKNVSMGLEDIIANEIFQGPGYVEIKEDDFAIRVQDAKLTKE